MKKYTQEGYFHAKMYSFVQMEVWKSWLKIKLQSELEMIYWYLTRSAEVWKHVEKCSLLSLNHYNIVFEVLFKMFDKTKKVFLINNK